MTMHGQVDVAVAYDAHMFARIAAVRTAVVEIRAFGIVVASQFGLHKRWHYICHILAYLMNDLLNCLLT